MVSRERKREYELKYKLEGKTKAWRDANRDKIKSYQEKYRASEGYKIAKERKKLRREERYLDKSHRLEVIIKAAKARSKKNNRDIDIDYLYSLEIPDRCPCCNEAFDYTTKGSRGKSISLDRFNNALGYVRNNVRIICAKCNSMKSDLSIEDVKMLIRYMLT